MGRDPGSRVSLVAFLFALCILAPVAAAAYPEGAPWSEAQRGDKACDGCHFGATAVIDSPAIALEGADGVLQPGETYRLTIRFTPGDQIDARVAGLLASFHGSRADAGSIAVDGGLEVRDSALRSTAVRPLVDGSTSWSFDWTAPARPGPVTLHVVANAANDDASPFGDTPHIAAITLNVTPSAR